MSHNDTTPEYTVSVYAIPPFYRITYTHPALTTIYLYQKILLHAFGAFLYTSIHMLSSVLIYIATEQAEYALWIGGLYLCYSMVQHLRKRDGLYIVDVETGMAPQEIKENPQTNQPNEPPCIPSPTLSEIDLPQLESSLKED